MKFKLLMLCMFVAAPFFSQIPAGIKFDKNFVEAENHWVILPPKNPAEKEFYIGYVYFDNSGGGYSIQEFRKSTYENGRFKAENIDKKGFLIQRLSGNTVDFAFVPEEGLQQMQLEKFPASMKVYDLEVENDDKKLNRGSTLNGMGRPDLALPILQNLHSKKWNNAKLYYELTFAHNALRNFDEAIKISEEAEKKGFVDELLLKERNYAYIHNNQLDKGAEFLLKNLKHFSKPLYKEESIALYASSLFQCKRLCQCKKMDENLL